MVTNSRQEVFRCNVLTSIPRKNVSSDLQPQLSDGGRLCCLGDEPFSPLCRQDVENADWLMSEAFCLYEDRDRFLPYEKHHSTVLDAARLAEELGVKNLILYHTEDRTLDTRCQRYMAEAKTAFSGRVFVPDDLEKIML